MTISTTILRAAALAAGLAATAAAASPAGVWIDHTGRGAVEIAECGGGGLCGHVVWVKDNKNAKACRTQIIGNVRPVGGNTWDRGWIVDPDDNQRYSVELKPVGEDRLRVTGYMGSKLFSETMMWKRAPADLKRCDGKDAATPAAAPAVLPPVVKPVETAVPQAPTVAAPEQQIAPFGTPTPSPAAPQRETAAPPAAVPAPLSTPAEPRIAEPAPRQPEMQIETQTERRGRRQAGGRSRPENRDCTLDLPYITIKYPCDAF